jgi:adenylate kinase family enzyme
VEELAGRDSWILDGNYGGTLDVRLTAAGTIIFLDLPRMTCIWRVLKRSVQSRGRRRPNIALGCPERFNSEFLQFLGWIWNYPSSRRPSILEKIERHADGAQVHILQSPDDVERFVRDVKGDAGPSIHPDVASRRSG